MLIATSTSGLKIRIDVLSFSSSISAMAASKTATAHAVETLQRENNHVKRGSMTVTPNDMQQQGGQAAAIFFAKYVVIYVVFVT